MRHTRTVFIGEKADNKCNAAGPSDAPHQHVCCCLDVCLRFVRRDVFILDDTHQCLKHRRVIFIGDSLSTQQGDSLLGMLGWHPSFLTLGDPRNWKVRGSQHARQIKRY